MIKLDPVDNGGIIDRLLDAFGWFSSGLFFILLLVKLAVIGGLGLMILIQFLK